MKQSRQFPGTTILILIITAGLVATASNLPFDPSRGLVEIPVTINGSITGLFGIDTGADHLYVNRAFALKNDLLPKQTPASSRASGMDGSSQAQKIALGSLKIGDEATLMNVPGEVIDLDALSGSAGSNPDGLIGFDVLRQFYITLDYPNKAIELRTDSPSYLDGKPYHTLTFRPFRHLIMVEVTIGDLTVPMALDFCSNYTVVSTELAARLELTPGAQSLVQLPQVAVTSDLISTNIMAVVKPFDEYRRAYPQLQIQGLLGGTFLESHVITIDYRTNHIYVPYR
jgi:hypothetical protein